MKGLTLVKIVACLVLLMGTLAIVACRGVTITPNDNGDVNIAPDNGNSGNNNNPNEFPGNEDVHAHSYKRDDSKSTFSCTDGDVIVYVCNCGDTMTKTFEASGHNLRKYEGKAPTCLENGHTEYVECINANCSYSTYSVIESTGHKMVYYTAKSPTCTEYGWNAYTECQACGESTFQKIEALGHNYTNGYCSCGHFEITNHTHQWDNGQTTQVATCVSNGIKKFTCTDPHCGDTKYEEIDALGHDNKFFDAKSPTCTQTGWYAYDVCNRCGYSTQSLIPALGHILESVNGVAATCEKDGYLSYQICTRAECDGEGIAKPVVVSALGHSLKYHQDIVPTCTSYGTKDHAECMRDNCNYVEKKIIEPLGHQLQTVSGKAATCTESGYLSYQICTRNGCDGSGISAPETIPALGHDDVHYEAKTPTCTEHGWNAYDVCQRCERSTYIKINALGHDYKNGYCSCGHSDPGLHTHLWDTGFNVVVATCTSPGSIRYTCTDVNCGDVKTEEVGALGHMLIYYDAKAPTCTADGWLAYEECERCGYSTFKVDPAFGHSFNSLVSIVQPTCTTSGYYVYACVCGKTIMVEIEKLGHKFGEWYETKEATCTTNGQEKCDCLNGCGLSNTRTVSKLGHNFSMWTVKVAPTCESEGLEVRKCLNAGCSLSEENILSTITHNINALGKCTQCGKQVNPPLNAPEIKVFDQKTYTVLWDSIEGAIYYEIKIIVNGDRNTYITNETSYKLEEFFKNCTSLEFYIRAKAPDGSNIPDSNYTEHHLVVDKGSVTDYPALGTGVNLLENSYLDFENNKNYSSIFNKFLFDRIVADEETSIYLHDSNSMMTESIQSYTENLTTKTNNKFNIKGSVGYGNIAKVTMGYSNEFGSEYEKKTYNETQAIFYDMYYEYRGYAVGINDYLSSIFNDIDLYEGKNDDVSKAKLSEAYAKLEYILSETFIEHARMLENGEMSPEEFISIYGTHIITSAVYGADFTAHYEMLTSKSEASEMFGSSIKNGISGAIQACVNGVDIGLETSNEFTVDSSVFMGINSSTTVSKFDFHANGGSDPVALNALSFADINTAFTEWTESMDDRNEFAVIDVPDGSLYFVWDFLSDDYSNAKEILYNYFYTRCDEQVADIKDKINGLYKDFFDFDVDTGTLIFDLSAMQEPGTTNASLAEVKDANGNVTKTGVLYKDAGVEIFNGTTGLVTIYPKFSGHRVNKVVFIGGYLTKDSQQGRVINNWFEGIYIKFDENWTEDIEVEFVNFAYEAPKGFAGLDFSTVGSKNITIIVTGNNKIVGGNGFDGTVEEKERVNGCAGIKANDAELCVLGEGSINIDGGNGEWGYYFDNDAPILGIGFQRGYGGSGIEATNVTIKISGNISIIGGTGCSGGNGGNGIKAENIVIDMIGTIEVHGGNGGNGGNGSDADGDTENGTDGGSGGNGGSAIYATNVTLTNGNLYIIGGIGGNGGYGGDGDDGGFYVVAWDNNGDGGDGGCGGTGGYGIYAKSVTVTSTKLTGSIIGGNGGNGGNKGYAGKGGPNDASNGHNGAGGAGFKAISCDVYVANVIVTDGQDGRSGPRGQMG